MKPLSISEKTSIRIDKTGVMALQFMIRNEEDAISFVEIYVRQLGCAFFSMFSKNAFLLPIFALVVCSGARTTRGRRVKADSTFF
jgi:hypothetical protein